MASILNPLQYSSAYWERFVLTLYAVFLMCSTCLLLIHETSVYTECSGSEQRKNDMRDVVNRHGHHAALVPHPYLIGYTIYFF